MTSKNPTCSLLRPPGHVAQANARSAPSEADLGLASITRALDLDGRHGQFIARLLAELNTDPLVIGYRQDILDDLLRLPMLAAGFGETLPQLAELASAGRDKRWGDNIPLLQVADRLAELDGYVTCVEGLWAALDAAGDSRRANDAHGRDVEAQARGSDSHGRDVEAQARANDAHGRDVESQACGSDADHDVVHAAGLLALREALAVARADPDYQRLYTELPALRAQIEQAGSVTIGVNLDAQLRPESATIVSINSRRFAAKGTLLDRLFGERAAADAVRGIGGLYQADEGRPHTPEHELFRELSRLIERIVEPIAAAISRYMRLSSAWLVALEPEIAFYLGAARLFGELRAAGLSLCRPVIASPDERACTITRLYSLDLALRLRATRGAVAPAAEIVPNDVAFGADAAIFILTGPNSGGKTTYIRAIGQAQVLFQAGLLVPGEQARLSPADGIFTHFATAERLDPGSGRLAEELERLARIFRAASRNSLVLLNEPLASTDHTAARAIGRDIVAGLRLLGARAIVVTHLHELVDDVAAPDAGVVSLVAEVAARSDDGAEPRPTFVIAPGRPRALGYAAELARRHGLSLTQIAQMLRERGALPESEG